MLPDKRSDLLELAVNDAQAVSRRKNVTLNMGLWLVTRDEWLMPGGQCRCCMAGAVMLRTLGAPNPRPGREVDPEDFTQDLCRKLHAINDMRAGWPIPGFPNDIGELIADAFDQHLDGGRAPWHVYRKAIRMLRERGL